MCTYNRPDYVELCFETLFNSDLSLLQHLYIYDDASTDKEVLKMLRVVSKRDNVTVTYRGERLGCDGNMTASLVEISKKAEDVISIDSDSLFNIDWLNKLHELKQRVLKEFGGWAVLGVRNHEVWHVVNEVLPGLVQKDWVGGFAVLINKDYFPSWVKNIYSHDQSWDCEFGEYALEELGLSSFTTKNSYVAHIGREGSHETEDTPEVGFPGAACSVKFYKKWIKKYDKNRQKTHSVNWRERLVRHKPSSSSGFSW